MVDKTTPQDLAEKVEWVGFRNLSRREKSQLGECLEEACQYLPRLLGYALWKFYGKTAPEGLVTRDSQDSLDSFVRRDQARDFIRGIMEDYSEEDAEWR